MPSVEFVALASSTTAQDWVVPSGVVAARIRCWGAAGTAGFGSYAEATYTVTPLETLKVRVGRKLNGGDMSDVRRGGDALANQIIVGGGGGGAAAANTNGNGSPSGPPTAGGAASLVAGGSAGSGGTGVGTAFVASSGSAGGRGTAGAGGSASSGSGDTGAIYANATGGRGGQGYYGGGGGGAQAKAANGAQSTSYAAAAAGGRGSAYTGTGTSPIINYNVRSGHGLVQIEWGAVTNVAPNAALQSYPIGSQVVDRTEDIVVAWSFSDPDVGDTQSRWKLELRTQGTTTPLHVNQDQSNANQTYTITASTLAAGFYEWRVLTYDAAGLAGPWTTWEPFEARAPTTAPVVTGPASITTGSANVTWTVTNQADYQVRVLQSSAVIYDSGTVSSAATRSHSTPFSVTGSVDIDVRVRVNGLWSPRSTITRTVSWTPPAVPLLSVRSDFPPGAIMVETYNSDSVAYNELWVRVADGGVDDGDRPADLTGVKIVELPPTQAAFVDWAVASGVNYEYKARAVTSTGLTSDSAWISGYVAWDAYLSATVGTASLPDPGQLPNECTFIFEARVTASGGGPMIASQDVSGDRGWALSKFGAATTWRFSQYDTGLVDRGATVTINGVETAAGTVEKLAISVAHSTGGNQVVTAYRFNGSTWVAQTPVSVATFTSYNSSAPVRVGANWTTSNLWDGRIYSVELRTGLDPAAGSIIWKFDASDYPGTGTSYVDPRGHTWTLTSAAAIVRGYV